MRKLVITLLLISAITAAALGAVNLVTDPIIEQRNAEKTLEAMKSVIPDELSARFEELVPVPLSAPSGNLFTQLRHLPDTKFYIVEVSPSGFGGAIDMLVGVNSGKVTGVSIVSMSETSGLGANAKDPEWLGQFNDTSGSIAVTKDGGSIDALTGATITSRAVADGVNAALEAVEAHTK